jgi:hypothetical protein
VFTLVPSNFFDPAVEREALAEVVGLNEGDVVKHIAIPQYDAVLIFTEDGDSAVSGPEIKNVLDRLPECSEYNKILCSIREDILYMAVAQGKSLLFANSFSIQNFTTAEYYIFLAIKSLQINPEISTVCWLSPLDADDEMSLYRYFKAVARL